MTEYFSLPHNLFASLAKPVDFLDGVRKQYRVVFDIYDRNDSGATPRRYAVFINKRHLVSSGFWFAEDSQRSAVEYAKEILKRRFTYASPGENAAFCKGKICEFMTISNL